MEVRKQRNIGRIVALILTAPIVLFAALITLLYLPPVQHWTVVRVAEWISDATKMDVRVERIRLAFPLDLALKDVVVCDTLKADTLASLGDFRIGVAIRPLFRGEIVVSSMSLHQVQMHTGNLMSSVEVDGRIGSLRLEGGHVNPFNQIAEVGNLFLQQADVTLFLHPDTAQREKFSSPTWWKIFLGRAEIKQVNFQLNIPVDTLSVSAGWETTEMKNVSVDLGASAYDVTCFSMTDGSFSYNQDSQSVAKGFDPRHILVSDMCVEVDSLHYKGKEVHINVHQLSMQERSGFRILHTNGEVRMDSLGVNLPHLRIESRSSYLQAKGYLPWGAFKEGGTEQINAMVEGQVSLADVAVWDSSIFVHDSPMNIRLALHGNAKRMQLDTLALQMDSVIALNAAGKLSNLKDDNLRMGEVRWQARMHNPSVVMPLITHYAPSIRIPQGLNIGGILTANRTRYDASIELYEHEGSLQADGYYDTQLEEYSLNIRTDSLPLHRFLPHSTLSHMTARGKIVGKGLDPYASSTYLQGEVHVDSVQYGSQLISHVGLKTSLKEHQALVIGDSHNPIIKMQARVEGVLHRDSLKAKAMMNVEKAELSSLRRIEFPIEAMASVEMRPDSLSAQLSMGDFEMNLNGGDTPNALIKGLNAFVHTMYSQLKVQKVDIEKAKTYLPDLNLTLKAGKENPIMDYLHYASGIGLAQLEVDVHTSPRQGVFANGYVYSLRTDSLEFDTVKMDVATIKDTILVANLSVSNAPNTRKPVFTANLSGEWSNEQASALLHFYNDKHEMGLELGARASAETDGVRLSFFPENPTIGFRTFTLNEGNYISLSDSGKVEAQVEMLDKYGTGFRFYSTPNAEAEQDLSIDLTRLNLTEIVEMMPYAPHISGIMDAELHYLREKDEANTFSGTLRTENLTYEGYAMGTQELEAVYLPVSMDEHLISLQWIQNNEVTATMDGRYFNENTPEENTSNKKGQIETEVNLSHFPLDMANAFVPRDVVILHGLLNGNLVIKGNIDAPRIDGEVRFDSVNVHSPLYAVDFHFDKTPISINRNRLIFDSFNIYSKGKNPFTLTGNVDLGDFSHMKADLQMRAMEYELLNAKKNRNSVLHGKVLVSLYSTIKGELTSPVVRGSMNVLGVTDVTYVLKESSLTVEDRLGSMVTFVNLNDTISTPKKDKEVSIGGMDLLLNVQIDPGAQVQADLGNDNYVEVQGGGNLSMQLTPQGDMLLTGRYTLNSGEMKYSLPVIPLKTFNIAGGSYVDFTGNPANPYLHIVATERVRTSVTEDNNSRYVNFDVGVTITQTLENMGLTFTLDAPEDVTIQNQLAAMSAEERGKLAVTMLVTGMYVGGQGGGTNGFSTNNALNSFLQNEISNIAGNALKTVDVSIGVEGNYATDGTTQGGTDYSFRFAKRFWNNRLSVIIGGRISTGNEATAEGEGNSFIDDISLEWRLDDSGTRYVKLFHTKNYESILEGEIIETGVGLVLRRKVDRLGELFIFRRRK